MINNFVSEVRMRIMTTSLISACILFLVVSWDNVVLLRGLAIFSIALLIFFGALIKLGDED